MRAFVLSMLVLLSMLRPIFVIELLIDGLGTPLDGLFVVSMILLYLVCIYVYCYSILSVVRNVYLSISIRDKGLVIVGRASNVRMRLRW